MSGWGFAEDLASFASFVAESFLEDLIVLAGEGGTDAESLGLATDAEAAGSLLRADREWAAATQEFAAGVCALL